MVYADPNQKGLIVFRMLGCLAHCNTFNRGFQFFLGPPKIPEPFAGFGNGTFCGAL